MKKLTPQYKNPSDPDAFFEQDAMRDKRLDNTIRALMWFVCGATAMFFMYDLHLQQEEKARAEELPAECVQWWFDPNGSNPQRLQDAQKFMCQRPKPRT